MTSPPALAVPPTPEALHSLVNTIPAKTLHSYVLAHIPTAPPDTLVSLASFFVTLAPPPLRHCVRCHADYTEVENNNRSCRMPHDDGSAEAEWIGGSGRGEYEYETNYGCCDRTVEGDGDLGPPDGWCYEGMHTTNIKRARSRADSTPEEDMLVSCLELNCHNIRAQLRSAKASTSTGGRRAKRARPSPDEGDVAGDEDASAGTITQAVGALGEKGKGKAKALAKQPKATTAAAPASKPARTRARARGPVRSKVVST